MTSVRSEIVTQFPGRGYVSQGAYSVNSYYVDSAMDTDTDSWTLEIGDLQNDMVAVLNRDNEVRLNIFGMSAGGVKALQTGFADEITMDLDGFLRFTGRDFTAPAVDSQHPPQQWKGIRPEKLVEREAKALKLGAALKLSGAKSFKKYATDGSESYWQVWYRFYRKRRMWMWAEADGTLFAAPLDYNEPNTYFFGVQKGSKHGDKPFIPVEKLEWRANKQQRVGEVYVFGHRGDIGFVAREEDKTTAQWIKRPTLIIQSSEVHNQAEARAEAFEEVYESKVGAIEIRLTVYDPGFIIRQNNMAHVNLPDVGLTGDFFVVGTRTYGSVDAGFYQEVRLRERGFAISRRVPADPQTAEAPSSGTTGGIATNLSGFPWKQAFIDAAEKFHGPWRFTVFLGVLLAIAEQETGFRNVRGGASSNPYPENPPSVFNDAAYRKFAADFANEPEFGRTSQTYAVGPMQLYSRGYKWYADRVGGTSPDELVGARWRPEANIMAGAAALAEKLGANVAISNDGRLSRPGISGASLNPTEENIWIGVALYGHLFAGESQRLPTGRYAREVRARYENTYKQMVEEAYKQAQKDDARDDGTVTIPTGTAFELRDQLLKHSRITFTRASQRDDIRYGLVDIDLVKLMLAFLDSGRDIVVTALRSDHDKYTNNNSVSDHYYGQAVDMGNYGLKNLQQSESA